MHDHEDSGAPDDRTPPLSDRPVVRGPAGHAPPRPPGSVRRTASIDMLWPEGRSGRLRLIGRARDLLTPPDGGPARVLAEDELRAKVAANRTIEAIEALPSRPSIVGLVGARGGGGLRKLIGEVLPEERTVGTPLYLLLDDLAPATLIAGFAFSQWPARQDFLLARRALPRSMEGVCIGLRPGSTALTDGLPNPRQQHVRVPPLARPDDPLGWHPLDHVTGISARRARRIDVRAGRVLEIDAMFQDSATAPDGSRVAVHEYLLTATADPVTGELLTVRADPRVLPYPEECPLAAQGVHRLVGRSLTGLRRAVIDELGGTAGCTHLNDALRALAEVPALARHLTPAD